MPKRTDSADNHPFRRTSSGFESLIPRGGSEDFFFSQLLEDPEHAAEFFEHGGEDREPLLGDPRAGMVTSGVAHVLLILFVLFEPSVAELFNLQAQPDPQPVAEAEETVPLVFMAEPIPQPPQVAAVPVVPVVPAPEAQPAPPPPVNQNSLLIPKALLEAEQRAEIMNDLPFSTGNTDEFYTEEEVKDPGKEGDPGEDVEPEPMVADTSGEDDVESLEVEGADDGNNVVKAAAERSDASELPDFLFRDSVLEPTEKPRREEAREARTIRPPERVITRGEGAGGEDGRLTDIRRFLQGSQFHNPEGGLVVNSGNTMYYNDQGANFVPWIRRMLTEVGRTWRAGMPWAANIYRGHVAIQFAVDRSGNVTGYETVFPSGVAGFDNIAVGAIRAADLLPLPSDYPDDQFEIILVFWYNERPYDLFG